jgi:hypothetical protein
MTTLTAGLTSSQTLVQFLRTALRRFLDAILKADTGKEAAGRYEWGRGL